MKHPCKSARGNCPPLSGYTVEVSGSDKHGDPVSRAFLLCEYQTGVRAKTSPAPFPFCSQWSARCAASTALLELGVDVKCYIAPVKSSSSNL